jgi:hypothetical protein
MGEATADRAAVAYRWVADVYETLSEKRARPGDRGRALGGALTGERSDPQLIALDADLIAARQAKQIDEEVRSLRSACQQWHEALPARQRARPRPG